MIILEVTEDKFGDIMKNIKCMEEKLHLIKSVFENESMGLRYRPRYNEDYHQRDYDKDDYRKEYYNRYI